MAFYVYENWTHSKAKVHNADCGACRYGKGMHDIKVSGRNDKWHGPFYTVEEAIVKAKSTGQPVSPCGLCNPY